MDRLRTPVFLDFLGGSAGKESACNAQDLGLIPGLGRVPRRMERLPTPIVFWPGEFHGLYRPWSRKESDMTERLSLTSMVFPVLMYMRVGPRRLSAKELMLLICGARKDS